MSLSTSATDPSSPPRRRRRARSWAASLAGLATLALAGMTAGGLAPTAEATTPPVWQTEPTPALTGAGFAGISCPTTTTCVAVGSKFADSHSTAVAETETSGTWHIDTLPLPPKATDTYLGSVSCTSATTCVAVGFVGTNGVDKAFSEIMGNGVWTILPTATLSGVAGAEFASVSCIESGDCWAVGSWYPPSGNGGTLVEHYNGTQWKLIKTLALKGSADFTGVSCLTDTTPALCTAVGSLESNSRSTPLVEHGNASSWSVVSVPNVAGSTETSLASVSCPQPTSCVAVGDALSGTTTRSVSEIENDLHWTVVTPPRPSSAANGDGLDGVSCPLTIDSCRAVGFYGTSGTFSLAEGWNGTGWAVQSSTTPPSDLAELLGVSCLTVGTDGVACTAAGEYQDNPQGPSNTLVEKN